MVYNIQFKVDKGIKEDEIPKMVGPEPLNIEIGGGVIKLQSGKQTLIVPIENVNYLWVYNR